MGYNLIEFNGLPGCGKSTLTEFLFNSLKIKGYKVLNEKDIFVKKNKILKVIDLIRAIFCWRFFRFNTLILNLGFKIISKSKSTLTILKSLKIIYYNWTLYNKIHNTKFDYLIMSEGFIQFLSTLIDDIQYEEDKTFDDVISEVISEVIRLYNKILIINCNIEVKKSIERVKNRISIPNNIDLMEENDRIFFMYNRNNNIKELRKTYKDMKCVIEINTLKSVEYNLNEIMLELEHLYKFA